MTKKLPKLISLVIPLYNEAESLLLAHQTLSQVFKPLPYRVEFVFVNDSSTDNSIDILTTLEKQDSRVKVIDLTRNFGKEVALTAGLDYALGDAAIMLDADLQHPPQYIPEFLTRWEQGAEVVVGIRQNNNGQSWFKTVTSKLFYQLINKISETPITPHATDFRLLDRSVIDAFICFSERNRITRGLIDWLGFNQEFVYFKQQERKFGQPSYTLDKLIRLAIDSITYMSFLPLKLAGYLGMLIIAVAGPLGLFIFVENYLLHDPLNLNFSGPAILGVIILFLVGIILVCLGLIALYIANIHSEVSNRPLYIVRRKRQ